MILVTLIQEVAIKKMRSNKSKEFFAELKVLCKIHHINVVSYRYILSLKNRESTIISIHIYEKSMLEFAGRAVGLREWRRPPLLGL